MNSRPGWSQPPEQRVRTPPWAATGRRDVRLLFPAARSAATKGPLDGADALAKAPERRSTPAELKSPAAASASLVTNAGTAHPTGVTPAVTASVPAATVPRPDLEKAVAQLKRATIDVEETLSRFRSTAPLEVLDLALVIAREVLHAEPTVPSRDKLEAALREALQSLGDGPWVVRLHPDDVEVVDQLRNDRGDVGALEVLLDPTMSRGDLVVEGGLGRVDATRATRLKAIERKLRSVIGADAHGGGA